jgi:two-component system chemotaxis sensor kinase CheA
MNLVGELVLARNQILQHNSQREDAGFAATSQRLNLITSELQENVMKTRMQPIGVVWNKLPRVVRDLASTCGKQISLEMDGADTELDKTIIEAIKDPLTHIVRNCCDHGIETPEVRLGRGKPGQGRLFLHAFHEGGHVNIEVADDGAGIDGERVKQKAIQRGLITAEQAARMSDREADQLIFLPGLSTVECVTSISGRGVGMDVVRTNVEKIGGVVDMVSERGSGTTVKIKIPLTLAIIPGLIITGSGMRFVIPQVSLLELIRLEGDEGKKQIERIHGAPVYRRRGQLLPIAYLNELLNVPVAQGESDVINIVVLQTEDRQFGLVVDEICDTQEIVVKPIGKLLKGVSCYAGATIMGDGHVALILDVMGVAHRSGITSEMHTDSRAKQRELDQERASLTTLLLFQIGAFQRLAVPLSLVARLEEFATSRIESAAGEMVIQYRGGILPLVTFDGVGAMSQEDTVQVVVFSDGDRQIGLMVDRILDIVEEQVTVKKKSTKNGILGSAVVGKHLTDFLDLEGILESNRSSWSVGTSSNRHQTILVADGSAFSRSLVRSYLEMEGHSVVEAASVADALKSLKQGAVSLLLASPELPGGGPQLLRSMASASLAAAIPVVALVSSEEQAIELRRAGHPYQDFRLRTDREAVLQSIRSLARALEVDPQTGLPRADRGVPQPVLVH